MVSGLWAACWHLHLECLPDGIGVPEIPSCERLVHDRRLRRVGPVSTVERPACEERRLHHVEVVAADFVEVHVAVLHCAARHDASIPITAAERHDQRLGGVAHAGDLLEARHDGSEGLSPRLGPHRGSAQVDSHHHHVRIEAQFDRAEVFQGAPEEQRADHEHHRERDLHDHQPAPQRERLVSFGRRSAAGLHGIRQITASGLERRAEAEQHAREDRDGGHERKHAPVWRQVQENSAAARVEEHHQRLAHPAGEQQPAHGAQSGEQHALGQHLTDHPAPRRANRQTHGNLAAAGGGARQHQVREIEAGE